MKNLKPLPLLALIVIIACGQHEEIVTQPTPVKVQVVAGSAAGGGLRYSANVAPDVQVELAFKVSGYIDNILQVRGADGRMRNVQDGDFIKKGTVLAHVRDNEYRDRVAEAQAGLTQAKADYERTAKLYETKSASKADYDGAYARLSASQARYAQAAQSLDDCILRAPMDGFVLRRSIEVGNLAGPGSLGFILADTRSVKVVFGVPDVLVEQMKMGDFQIVTTEAIPGAEFRGRITRVAPSADPSSRVFEIECTVPNPDNRLKVGMIAALQVSTSALPNPEILVPLNAIVRPVDDPQGYAAFVVEEQGGKQKARMRRVKLGAVSGNAIAVKEGLQGGERLIIRGATIVVDEQEVRIIP
jgi:multidrug efflux system membrane fusion protein